MRRRSRFLPCFLIALASSVFFSGCHEKPELEPESAVTLGPNGKPLPLMSTKGGFFGGAIVAEIRLSQSRGRGGFHAAPIHGLPSAEESEYADPDDIKITPEIVEEIKSRKNESPLPPIAMWLRVTNASGSPVKVEIVNFNSDLGNFAVDPDHFSLAPGAAAEPEPMISRLGVTSLQIPVTVTLQLNGKKETQVLTLRPVENQDGKAPAAAK